MTTVVDAKTRMEQAQEEYEQAKTNFNTATADIVRARISELKAEHPTITKIGFVGNYEYDDEGSYNWSVHPRVEFTEDETTEHSYEREEYPLVAGSLYQRDYRATPTITTVTYTTGLDELVGNDDVLNSCDIDAWQAATGSDDPESGGCVDAEGYPDYDED